MSTTSPKRKKYGFRFPDQMPELAIEFWMIKKGSDWLKSRGSSLFFHYKEAQKLLWPHEDHHRWSDLILSEILENDITALLGAKDSGKTHGMCKYGLTDYFCFPEETLFVVSSTDMRSLELRVWGDIKTMFIKAHELHPWLPGHVLDSKHAICTDDLDDESVIARDMRKGILCIPCKNASGGQTNIASYVGIKQKRRRYLADEFQFMSLSMYEALGNANSGDFKLAAAGNPIGQGEPLDLLSEPVGGWLSMPEPEKTTVWTNMRFLRSRTVNLVGTDSPNFDYDQSLPPKFPYLTNKNSIARTVAGYGENSHQYYSQCKGVRRSGLNARRVITREICVAHKAFEQVTWKNEAPTKIFALDAAYGGIGGDRCVGGHIEFGLCTDNVWRILIKPHQIVPVSIKLADSPEDQIAVWAKAYCDANGIPYENGYYDATGRGSLGLAFARKGMTLINPVEFGGAATDRPVSMDLMIFDEETKEQRLKKCSEHYRKFVTELWWTVRIVVESDQIRGMTEEIISDGCMREWKEVAGAKIEVEPKEDTKERMGKSPDIFDWLVTAVEGARRKGFLITKLSNLNATEQKSDWLDQQNREYQQFLKQRHLSYA